MTPQLSGGGRRPKKRERYIHTNLANLHPMYACPFANVGIKLKAPLAARLGMGNGIPGYLACQ